MGSKRGSGSPTNLINKSENTVVVINEALVGVMIRFICENPRSASLEEIAIVASLLGVNILTPSKLKVIIFIFHNLEKVPVRRTGASRHKKTLILFISFLI